MNEVMVSCLNVEEELVTVVSNYLSSAGGKRIRPVLTLLSSRFFGYKGESHVRLAAAVEFIHMATLLHDDVVDGSKMRRFLPTANTVWGSKASILVGDFLFSQSFKLIVSTKSIRALEVLSNSAAVIAEGEVSQLARLEEHRLITEAEYLKIIKAKTAELFASATEVGAIISGQGEDECHNMREFGQQLGVIFQIADDALDYFGDNEKSGKNTGADFAEGKVTLPYIILHDLAGAEEKDILTNMITKSERDEVDYQLVQNLMTKYDIASEVKKYLAALNKKANSYLELLGGDADAREFLEALVDFAIERAY